MTKNKTFSHFFNQERKHNHVLICFPYSVLRHLTMKLARCVLLHCARYHFLPIQDISISDPSGMDWDVLCVAHYARSCGSSVLALAVLLWASDWMMLYFYSFWKDLKTFHFHHWLFIIYTLSYVPNLFFLVTDLAFDYRISL